jgi:chemotaxis protein MotB
MGRANKQVEPDEAAGAPEWMVTFSDCMTLLLTFFVLLLSFSSFDELTVMKLSKSFFKAFSSASSVSKRDKDSLLKPVRSVVPIPDLYKGSEKPTLVTGLADRLKEETEPSDFYRRRVFSISSKKIFCGKSTVISPEGRSIMATMASFLKEVPSRIVISENGPADVEGGGYYFGLPRAWAVLEYLTTKQSLDRKRFSISSISTLAGFPRSGVPQESLGSDEIALTRPEPERTVEIVLLERSIYN